MERVGISVVMNNNEAFAETASPAAVPANAVNDAIKGRIIDAFERV
ncbi:hypothetical protein [Halobacillus seohaensis]|uniref:Uncharacterized protein n=1 Tax=Halobacillus seohaensis TaxID=447421 RepID=A0ABW2ERG7_9BACI